MPNFKHDLETRNRIAQEYLQGASTLALAKSYGVNRQTITNYMIELGIEMRTVGGEITPTQVKAIARAYADGASSTEVAGRFGVSVQTVLNAAVKHGVPVRDRGDYPMTHRKHFFNEDFFATWSPEMAYVLGFVFADGTVNQNELRLYQKEPGVVEMVAKVMGYDGRLHYCGTDRSIETVILSSRKMVADLLHLGVVPNKSLVAAVPSAIPYPAQFVRGYFDGDGHGGWYRDRKWRYLRIGFTSGSHAFLDGIKAVLPVPIGGPYQAKGQSWSLQTSGNENAEALRDWMYADASGLWVERKHKKLHQD